MSKKLAKIYFKRHSTVLRLDKFPKSYNFLMNNWNTIQSSYKITNKHLYNADGSLNLKTKGSSKHTGLIISKDDFIMLQNDLSLKNAQSISLYYISSSFKFVEIKPEK